jgi:Ca2+-binding EF-hand superfamily protein
MRFYLGASVVLLFASTAAAQFGNNNVRRTVAEPTDAGQRKTAENSRSDRAAKLAEQAAAQEDLAGALLAVMDTDGDGMVTRVEFGKAMAALRKVHKDTKGNMMVPEKAKNAAATTGGDSTQNAAGTELAGERGNVATTRFMEMYDRNHDGVITANEVPPQVRAMLRGADRNGDGRIDAAELQAFSQRMNQLRRAGAEGANANGGAGVPGDGGGPLPPRP